MLIVGLTGGIASGKSTVSSILSAEYKIPLVDLDILAREAVSPDSYALSALVTHFGPSILNADRSLDRAKLGEIIFNNEKQRKVLNSIVHPAVRRLLAWELIKLWLKGEKLVIVDAPLLIEAGLWKWCGAIIVVYCSDALQHQRLVTRNSLSPSSATSRIKSQQPLSSKLRYADYVLDNSGSLPDLTTQVSSLVNKLRARTRGIGWLFCWLLPVWGLLKGMFTIYWRLKILRIGEKGKEEQGRGTRGERSEVDLELRKMERERERGGKRRG